MLRNFGAAILGYLASFAVVFVVMSVAWLIMGADGAFRPGVWDQSNGWIALAAVVGFVSAAVGGNICARVGTDRNAVWILVAIVAGMGILAAMPEAGPVDPVRPDGVTMWEAMANAIPPAWARWAGPLIGVVGTLVGAAKAERTR